MVQRWTATLRISWHPILTFERRRLDLLDWIDQHLEIVAFKNDSADEVAVAVGHRGLRGTITMKSMSMSTSSPSLTVDALGPLFDGAYDVLGLHGVRVVEYQSSWTAPLEGSYSAACGIFARNVTFHQDLGEFAATDASVLFDAASDSATLQAEMGVVSSRELRARIMHPAIGRHPDTSRPTYVPDPADELPELSLFADVRWFPSTGMSIASGDELAHIREHIENDCATMMVGLGESVQATLEGGGDEFSSGGSGLPA
ncbi:hypothetical protein [Nakamurella sp.]|uniref:hypothetical protein n=1 Tax=Nakamurella sp. TaxID=1869182 RepID=UPI003783B0C0